MLTFLSRWREAVLCFFSYTQFDSSAAYDRPLSKGDYCVIQNVSFFLIKFLMGFSWLDVRCCFGGSLFLSFFTRQRESASKWYLRSSSSYSSSSIFHLSPEHRMEREWVSETCPITHHFFNFKCNHTCACLSYTHITFSYIVCQQAVFFWDDKRPFLF